MIEISVGKELTDQAYLLLWAELAVDKIENEADKRYILEHLVRAKKRIDDMVMGYFEK